MSGNRSRVLRWAAPAAAVAAVAVAASGALTATADPPLPPKTAAALLVDLQHPNLYGLSGTVVQKSDLGLPLPPTAAEVGRETLASLLTSSHTVRVWNAGTTKQRLALLDTLGESDLVRNGRDVWLWSSSSRTATHYTLPPPAANEVTPAPLPPGLTPQDAADAALRAIDPTTAVSTDGTSSVAGRAAYELVLSPRDTRSLVGQVRLAMDAETHLPLRVQVYGRDSRAGPAFEVGYTRISYARPGDEQFRFSPPTGVTVREGDLDQAYGESAMPDRYPGAERESARAKGVRVIGDGWTAVAVIDGVQSPTGRSADQAGFDEEMGKLLDRLPEVSGAWGRGRLLTSTLLSVLLTDDGRLLVGAVSPDLLYAAAGQR
jgi:outer membrane lipoprotein-sorting protein